MVLILGTGGPSRSKGMVLADERVQFLPRKGGGLATRFAPGR